VHLCLTRNRFLRLRDKSWINHITKEYSGKIENFPKKIKDRKQLERFRRCLIYALDFIKDLAKQRKPLQ